MRGKKKLKESCMAVFKASKDHNQVYRTASEISDKSGQLLGRTRGQNSYCLKWSRELVHFASQLPSFLLTSAFTSCWLELRVLPFLHRQRIPGAWGTRSLYCLQLQIFERTGHGNTEVQRPIHFWVIYLAIWREYSLAEGGEEHHSRLLCERNKQPRELREHSRILPTSWSQSIHGLTSDWEENYSQLGKEVTSVSCMSRSHLIPFCLLQIILPFQSVCKCEREGLEREDMDRELFATSGLGLWRRGLTHPSFPSCAIHCSMEWASHFTWRVLKSKHVFPKKSKLRTPWVDHIHQSRRHHLFHLLLCVLTPMLSHPLLLYRVTDRMDKMLLVWTQRESGKWLFPTCVLSWSISQCLALQCLNNNPCI